MVVEFFLLIIFFKKSFFDLEISFFIFFVTRPKTCYEIFFWIRGNPTSRKAHFVGPGERVKPRLSQTLTRGARPDSNSKPVVHISSPLSSPYAPWEPCYEICSHFIMLIKQSHWKKKNLTFHNKVIKKNRRKYTKK